MHVEREDALLNAELAALGGVPYGQWREALNTTYEKRMTDPTAPGRHCRLTVSAAECDPISEEIRVTVTLTRAWGLRSHRRSFVIPPAELVERSRAPDVATPVAPQATRERRQHLRMTWLPLGSWRQGDAVREVSIADLSIGGCFCLSADTAPTGRIGVHLALPPPTDPIDVSATVVRAQPGTGFGAQFTDLPAIHRQALSQTAARLTFRPGISDNR